MPVRSVKKKKVVFHLRGPNLLDGEQGVTQQNPRGVERIRDQVESQPENRGT